MFRIIFLRFLALLFYVNLSLLAKEQNEMFNFYTLEGKEKGATLLVIGGIHGDEPGGYFAPAFLVNHYRINKGALLVVPNLNPHSMMAFKRGVYKDMNRKFAKIDKNDPDFNNVESIKKLIRDERVDFVINLHDGYGFYRETWENSIFNPRAWGQTYVIDQKTLDNVKFGNLDEIVSQIEAKLNDSLHYDFHTFKVRNTETKFKDEEQQNSLTFYAITHLKPALAIETSKNIKELPLKTLYQLSSIEALMQILGITYERDFELNLENVQSRIDDFGSVSINKNITLPLNEIKKRLNFFPLLKSNNDFAFTHPLGGVKKSKDGYELYIGHKKITTLKADIFNMQCSIKEVSVQIDGQNISSNFGDTMEFSKDFLIKGQSGMRVNVIGYSKKGVVSEHNLLLKKSDMDKNYSLDTNGHIFRAEMYEGKNFCGMINLKAK